MPPQAKNSTTTYTRAAFEAERILVMRYRFIGDTILTVPFLRNLRRAFPHARIDVLVGPQSGKVLTGCPYVDELIEFDTTRFHKYDSGSGAKKNFWTYAHLLHKRQYDTVFVLKRSLSSAFLAFLTGAKRRIGYSANGRDFLLTHKAPFNTHIHEVESTLDVLRCADLPIEDNYLEAWVSPEESAQLLKLAPELASIKKPVLLHAAAAHPDKVYPLQFWVQIARTLSKSDFTPVFSGAPMDTDLYKELETMSGVHCLNLAGKLSLRQSMALYKQMKLAICVDSGPAHLSAAVGTPTIAIFGPTDPVRWRPFGEQHVALFDQELTCRPCNYKKTCVDRPCLTQFDPGRVIEAALEVYARREGLATTIIS